MVQKFVGIICLTSIFLNSMMVYGEKPVISGEVTQVGDATHLEFSGLSQWIYDLKKNGNSVTLTTKPFDDKTYGALIAASGPHIANVKIDKSGPDGNYIVTFQLADARVESFDYLTADPSRLIIDFYRVNEVQKKIDQVAEVTPSKSKPIKNKKSLQGKANQETKSAATTDEEGYKKFAANKDRKPAGDELLQVDPKVSNNENEPPLIMRIGAFDGADDLFERFRMNDYDIREEAIIASRLNIYLPFPMLKMPVSRLEEMMKLSPEYEIRPREDRENKEARLLLTLFNKGRHALFLKTYSYFIKKYPDSEYDEIIRNLAAHIYFQLWYKNREPKDYELAKQMYTDLLKKYPQSQLAERIQLLLAYADLERKEGLATIQRFHDYIQKYPQGSEVTQARKALAEGFLSLNKFDDAYNQYQSLSATLEGKSDGMEAIFRLGDVLFAKTDYSGAVVAYESAIKRFPAMEKVFPNAHYNMGEALFWTGKYKESLDHYIRFLTLFPGHNYGGYAMTRIGELLGILGADTSRMMGAFLESYFRYPNNPGSKVARIRMLGQRMKGMKEKELRKALEEMEEITKNLKLPGMDEFGTLMVADGLQNREQYEKAIATLISFYQRNPTAKNLDALRRRILRNISNELLSRVNSGAYMKVLDFYSQYSNTWLKNSDRIDVHFLVARAFEQSGVLAEANHSLKEILERRKNIVGKQEEKERRVNEHLPSVSMILLRLAATAVKLREFTDAYQYLRDMKDDAGLTADDQLERVQLAARVAEERGQHNEAKTYLRQLASTWKGEAVKMAPVYVRLAELNLKTGDTLEAEKNAEQAILQIGSNESQENLLATALELKATSQLQQGKALEAVESFQNLLERFEDKRSLSSVRYRTGLVLFDHGDLKGAEKVWSKLQGRKGELFWQMAEEKLRHAQWQSDYKKYIRRIPAMATRK